MSASTAFDAGSRQNSRLPIHFWNNVGSFGWQAKRFFLHHRLNGPQNLPNAANNKHRESEQRGVADDAMLKRATSFEPNVVGADL